MLLSLLTDDHVKVLREVADTDTMQQISAMVRTSTYSSVFTLCLVFFFRSILSC